MFSIAQFVAVLVTTLFAGAALHISLAEHSRCKESGSESTATEWAPIDRRGTGIQAPLAGLGGFAGLLAWLMGGGVLWLIGALLILAAILFTLGPIMPKSRQSSRPAQSVEAAKTEALFEKWTRLSFVRSVLSFVASCIYLALVVKT